MENIGWIIASVGAGVLVTAMLTLRMLRRKRSGVPLREERTLSQELMILGSSLVILGIVFGTDRLIGYSFIGAGVLLSIISAIKSRREEQRSSMEVR